MAINRYNLPANQPIMDTYAPLPFKELLLAGQSLQKQKDDLEAQRLELMDKEVYALPQDVDYVKSKKDYYDAKVDEIAGLYGTDLRKARQAVIGLTREMKNEWGQFGGIGSAMGNYNARKAWAEKVDEGIKKGTYNPYQKETLLAMFDKNYQGIGDGVGGKYNPYQTEEAAKWVNPTEWADKYGQGFMADLESFANFQKTNDGYIITSKSSGKQLTPEDIEAGLSNYFKGDPELQNMLRQGTKAGYANIDMLLNAIEGAGIKYGFKERLSERDIKGDPNYQYEDTKKQELKDNTPLVLSDEESIVPSKQEFNNEGVLGMPLSGKENFETAIGNVTNNMIRQESKLAQYQNELLQPGLSNPARESIQKNIKATQAAIEGERAKINTYKKIMNSFETSAYKVEGDKVEAIKGLGIEADRTISQYNEKINQIVTSQIPTIKEYLLPNMKLVIDPETKLANINLTSVDGSNVTDFAKYALTGAPNAGQLRMLLDQYNSSITNTEAQFNNKSKELLSSVNNTGKVYNPNEGIKGLYKFNNEIKNAQKVVDSKSDYYAKNRTTNNAMYYLSDTQVEKIPAFSQMSEALSSKETGDFYLEDKNTGKKVKWEPRKIYAWEDQKSIEAQNKLTFKGFKTTAEGNMVPFFETGDGKIVEKDINITKGTNIANKLTNFANNYYNYAAQTGDEIEMANAANLLVQVNPNTSSTYKDYLEAKRLVVDVDASEGSGLIPSTPINLPNKMNVIIAKDNTVDLGGEVYNVYLGTNLTQDKVERGEGGNNYQAVTEAELDSFMSYLILQNEN